MLGCLMIGDSIAVGLGGAVNRPAITCDVAARVAASARAVADAAETAARTGPRPVVILSVGSNDSPGERLDATLRRIRAAFPGSWVTWILPYNRRTAYSVTRIGFEFGDDVVDLGLFATRDGVHPSDYRSVAAALR